MINRSLKVYYFNIFEHQYLIVILSVLYNALNLYLYDEIREFLTIIYETRTNFNHRFIIKFVYPNFFIVIYVNYVVVSFFIIFTFVLSQTHRAMYDVINSKGPNRV